MLTCSVPSRPIRAGHALRAIASPTAAGQRPQISPRSAGPPKRVSSRAERVRQPSPGVTSTTWLGSAGSAERCVVVITVWPSPATEAARMPRRRESSSESTSSSRSSGVEGRSAGLGEQEREQREPLLALRAEARAARGRRRRSRGRRGAGPRPGRPAREVGVEARLERRDRRRPRRRRRAAPSGRPSSAEALAEGRLEQRQRRLAARLDEPRAELGDALRPRRDDLAWREPELNTSEGGVPLRERRRVLLRQAGLRRAAAARAPGRGRRGEPPARP